MCKHCSPLKGQRKQHHPKYLVLFVMNDASLMTIAIRSVMNKVLNTRYVLRRLFLHA